MQPNSPVENVAYAYVVQATIPSGTVVSIDQGAATRCAGVYSVITAFNAPKVTVPGNVNVLQDNNVLYNGQPIAVVVARSLPEAQQAAKLLRIEYKEQPAKLDFNSHLKDARQPKRGGSSRRGDPEASLAKASVVIEQTYSTPIQNHNPMEPHATIASWDGDKLSVYDATQGISGVQGSLAHAFSIPPANVHVQCPYTGGGFGCKGYVWSHTILAAMAAKVAQRPVKLVLGREQMFGPVGSRPNTYQHIKLAASADGKLLLTQHDSTCYTSLMSDWIEGATGQTQLLYDSESLSTSQPLVDLNLGMGTWMRAPGEATGSVGLEIALDELAEKLNIDPIQLRLINYADKDPRQGLPWSSKHLRECYAQASERFGWSKRTAQPGQHREGNKLIGYGMATANYNAGRRPSSAVVRFLPNGRVFVGVGTQDIGTGTYTIIAQTAADHSLHGSHPRRRQTWRHHASPLWRLRRINHRRLGLPGVYDAAIQAKLKLAQLAIADAQSPFHGATAEEIHIKDGKLFLKSNPEKSETFTSLIARNGNTPVEATATSEMPKDRESFSSHSWGAIFAEVAVDADTHMVQVRRMVGTYDIGTLINEKTGTNQLIGGVVWGSQHGTPRRDRHRPNLWPHCQRKLR